jgi:hypothetical protein
MAIGTKRIWPTRGPGLLSQNVKGVECLGRDCVSQSEDGLLYTSFCLDAWVPKALRVRLKHRKPERHPTNFPPKFATPLL